MDPGVIQSLEKIEVHGGILQLNCTFINSTFITFLLDFFVVLFLQTSLSLFLLTFYNENHIFVAFLISIL